MAIYNISEGVLADDVGLSDLIPLDQAVSDLSLRATRHSQDCITIALVTSPTLSGELIDLAVQYADAVRRARGTAEEVTFTVPDVVN